MKRSFLFFQLCFLGLLISFSVLAQPPLQKVNLGDVVLGNGKVIENCQLGYRTFGKLNEDRSNVILFPGWLGGTSERLIDFIGKDRFLDDTKYFIIAVDPIGNGVSTSPSNYIGHAESDFPIYTIGDMVKTT